MRLERSTVSIKRERGAEFGKKNDREGRSDAVVDGVERCKRATRCGTGGVFKPSKKHLYLKVKLSIWIVDIKRECGAKLGDSN